MLKGSKQTVWGIWLMNVFYTITIHSPVKAILSVWLQVTRWISIKGPDLVCRHTFYIINLGLEPQAFRWEPNTPATRNAFPSHNYILWHHTTYLDWSILWRHRWNIKKKKNTDIKVMFSFQPRINTYFSSALFCSHTPVCLSVCLSVKTMHCICCLCSTQSNGHTRL